MAYLAKLNRTGWPVNRAKTMVRAAILDSSYLSRRRPWEIDAICYYFVLVNSHLPSKINKELIRGNQNAFNEIKFPEKFIPVVLEARRLFDLHNLGVEYGSFSNWEDPFVELSDSLKTG